MILYDAFVWLGSTSLGVWLGESTAAFASTESVHIVALSLVGGSVLLTQLSVLGVAFKSLPPADVSRGLMPLMLAGLALVAASGAMLVSAGPFKYYTNALFPLKLSLLVAALATQWWLHWRITRGGVIAASTRLLALVSLLLWTSVVIAGRWLGLI